MKIARTAKRYLATMGYRVDLRPFHKQQVWLLVERMLALILQCVYALYVANAPRQYMQSHFINIVGILIYISLVSTIIETPTIFTLIDKMEQVINESEFFYLSINIFRSINMLAPHSALSPQFNSRIKIPKIQGNVRKNQSICGKIQPNLQFCTRLCVGSYVYNPESDHQFLHVLH